MRWLLHHPEVPRVVVLPMETRILGRSTMKLDRCADATAVSRRHARVHATEDALYVRDGPDSNTPSLNGTRVVRAACTEDACFCCASEPERCGVVDRSGAQLYHGDRLVLGPQMRLQVTLQNLSKPLPVADAISTGSNVVESHSKDKGFKTADGSDVETSLLRLYPSD